MTLLQMYYINEICKCGSINKAAQNLFVSQSSLSSSIRELEDELGITIFKRSNRGISMTEAGFDFIKQIKPILDQYKQIKDIYSDKMNVSSPRLSIAAQRYPFCAKAFVEFLSKHDSDKFRFSLKEMNLYQIIEDISNRHSEIGVISVTDNRYKFMKKIFANHDIEYTELIKTQTRVFLREGHPLTQKENLTIDDLIPYPYVVFENNESSSINFGEEAICPESYNFKKVISVNDRATAYNVMHHTDGLSTGSGILPNGFCDEHIISINLSNESSNISIGYLKYIGEDLSENALEFIEILKHTLEELL